MIGINCKPSGTGILDGTKCRSDTMRMSAHELEHAGRSPQGELWIIVVGVVIGAYLAIAV